MLALSSQPPIPDVCRCIVDLRLGTKVDFLRARLAGWQNIKPSPREKLSSVTKWDRWTVDGPDAVFRRSDSRCIQTVLQPMTRIHATLESTSCICDFLTSSGLHLPTWSNNTSRRLPACQDVFCGSTRGYQCEVCRFISNQLSTLR